jgi:hypothetical protein
LAATTTVSCTLMSTALERLSRASSTTVGMATHAQAALQSCVPPQPGVHTGASALHASGPEDDCVLLEVPVPPLEDAAAEVAAEDVPAALLLKPPPEDDDDDEEDDDDDDDDEEDEEEDELPDPSPPVVQAASAPAVVRARQVHVP